MNVLYLKVNGEKLYLTDTNPEENHLELVFEADGMGIPEIKSAFSNLDSVIIYTAIRQEDGRETDEIVHQYFDIFTKLSRIEYDVDSDTYKVTLIEPDIVDERLSELEDAVNFLLMGGE